MLCTDDGTCTLTVLKHYTHWTYRGPHWGAETPRNVLSASARTGQPQQPWSQPSPLKCNTSSSSAEDARESRQNALDWCMCVYALSVCDFSQLFVFLYNLVMRPYIVFPCIMIRIKRSICQRLWGHSPAESLISHISRWNISKLFYVIRGIIHLNE